MTIKSKKPEKPDSIQIYESTSRFRTMSSAEFVEEVFGIKLLWYQKLLLTAIDIRDGFEKRYLPYYWHRHYR